MQQVAIPDAIATAIRTWAQEPDAHQLGNGPTIADLGGTQPLAEGALALSASPWFLYLIDAAGKADPETDPNPGAAFGRIDAAIVAGFGTHERPSSYASAVARLLRYPQLAARLGRRLERALLSRAEDATASTASARLVAIGGSALEALVHLVTTRVCKPHRLLAFFGDLVENISTMPADLKHRLPRLAGILHEHFPDNDLITLLRHLADDPVAGNDATFELALNNLRAALDAEDFPTIIDGLVHARRGFNAVILAGEQRHDAAAYAAAIDAIVAFNRRDVAPVQEASTRLENAVEHHAAWLAGCYSPPWMTTRHHEERAWQRLTLYLNAAMGPVTDDAWYRVDEAIGAMVDAYRASRSFIYRFDHQSNGSPGVDQLVRPVIEGTFIDNARNLSLLDKALATDTRFQNDDAAQQLSAAVHAAVTAVHDPQPAPHGGGGLGKDTRRVPAILQ